MFECKNRIEVCGEVRNFKLKETKSGKKFASISIKDGKKNNFVNVTMYARDNMKYGTKGDMKDVTLNSLQKVFLDSNDKPKGVMVSAVGTTSEYTSDNGTTYENNNVFSLYPCDDEERQKAVFNLQGIVESITSGENEDGEYVKIKVGMYNTRGKDSDRVILGVNYKTVVAHTDDTVEALEDVEKGDLVSLKGYIINELPKRDEFGDLVGKGKQEYEVIKGKVVKAADDLDDEDIKAYKKAKKLSVGETLKFPTKNDDFDDDEELD